MAIIYKIIYVHQTVGFLINGIVLESKPYVHAFMKFHTNYNDPAHDAKLSMTMPNFQFWHYHYGNFHTFKFPVHTTLLHNYI